MPWPAELPALSLGIGYQEEWPDSAYRTPTDSGPGRTRPRPDAPNHRIPRTQLLTAAQLKRLFDFRETELIKGSLSFDEFHPRTGELVSLRLVGPIRFDYRDGWYHTSFELEVLP